MSDVEKLGIDKVAEIALEIAWKDANCEKSILVICPTEASASLRRSSRREADSQEQDLDVIGIAAEPTACARTSSRYCFMPPT
jgi:hypothetical protein